MHMIENMKAKTPPSISTARSARPCAISRCCCARCEAAAAATAAAARGGQNDSVRQKEDVLLVLGHAGVVHSRVTAESKTDLQKT
jgi:hypothetical protein